MREIVFMWIVAIVSAAVGYFIGRGFKRNDDEWAKEPIKNPYLTDEQAQAIMRGAPKYREVRVRRVVPLSERAAEAPGAGSEPEEIEINDMLNDRMDAIPTRPSVLRAMTDWDAAREDEQRQGDFDTSALVAKQRARADAAVARAQARRQRVKLPSDRLRYVPHPKNAPTGLV